MIEPGTTVRFIGGKYNGFQGVVRWMGDVLASVVVVFEGKQIEVIESLTHLTPLADWIAKQSDTERILKGNPTL